ncbi:MAG: aminopeptidase, partial [Candidatus Limnocylindria bacterium]
MSIHPWRRRVPVAFMTAVLTLGAVAPVSASDLSESKGFRKAVTVAGIREHQAALQAIADRNSGTRLAGTVGYDESADYVQAQLESAGFTV